MVMADNPQKYVKVEAVIKPWKFNDLREALLALGIKGMTVTNSIGAGEQPSNTTMYHGEDYATTGFLPRVRLEVIVPEELSDRVANAMIYAAQTKDKGDGLVWVYSLNSVRQISDGQPYQP